MHSVINTSSGLRIEIDDAAKIVIVRIGSDADDRIVGRCRKEAWSRGYDLVMETHAGSERVH